MKLAVSSTGPGLDDAVESRFGRCAYFLIIDPDTMEFEALPNPNITQGGGAGIQSAQLMAEKNVTVVLTGNCGPNAFQTFGAAGIQVITGISGQVRQAVEQYKSGALAKSSEPNVQSHFGMGGGGGRGMGGVAVWAEAAVAVWAAAEGPVKTAQPKTG
ncbi:MAG: NifB/NifX family molybdenum-iron cluster-binding protein [Deltaproteobacteria bacterium]|nr:NifB/NifX family molybdenum-iron cluster-binding protein [Deltaproteobacteria bacterium]